MKDYTNYYVDSKDKLIHDGKELFQIHLRGFDAVDVLVNGFPRRLIVTEKYSTKEILHKIIDEHGLLNPGDLIFYNDKHWLVRKIDKENVVFDTGTLEYAPSSLKWITSTGEIKEHYFIFNSDNLSNFGVDEGRIISLLNDRRTIAIAKTLDSKQIEVGQRFIFDEAVWKVISINRLNPLIEIVVESDTIDPNRDNMELRIADFVKPNYEIILNQTSISLTIGETYQLNPTVENNGEIIPHPTLLYTSSNADICSVDENGLLTALADGMATISIDYKGVSVSIELMVESSPSHNYSAVINGDDFIYKSRSKAYTCHFYDDNQSVLLDGVFSVTDLEGNPTTLATILSQGNNTCTVRGDVIGSFLLVVTETTGAITVNKKIAVKSAL